MKFVTRLHKKRSKEDVSYYMTELGNPVRFKQATERLYFVVMLQFTRVGQTMRGEVVREDQAKAQIDDLCKWDEWGEMKTPFQ